MTEQTDKHKSAFLAAGGRETTKEIRTEVKNDAKNEKTGVAAKLGLKNAIEEITSVSTREGAVEQRKIVHSSGVM